MLQISDGGPVCWIAKEMLVNHRVSADADCHDVSSSEDEDVELDASNIGCDCLFCIVSVRSSLYIWYVPVLGYFEFVLQTSNCQMETEWVLLDVKSQVIGLGIIYFLSLSYQ